MSNPYELVNRKVDVDRRAQRVRQQQPTREQLLVEDARAILDELRELAQTTGRRDLTCPGCGSALAS